MGNAASIAELPPEWEGILPNITHADIIRSSRNNCRFDDQTKTVYLNGDKFDLDDDDHVPTALAILRAYPHLKDIRFKLVPGKMTEEVYWAALFGILHYGGIDVDDLVGKVGDDYETGDEAEAIDISSEDVPQSSFETPGKKPARSPIKGRTPIAKLERAYYDNDNGDAPESNADETNTPPFYLDEIKAQQAHIERLTKSLREANHKTRKLALELHKERTKRHGEGIANGEDNKGKDHSGLVANCPRCNSTLSTNEEQNHKGTWEIDPDCQEFMKLDDHLKDNLRKEKEKRLNEVRSQMKFILDTDNVSDTFGKWRCCGAQEYGAEGCV